MTTEIDALKQAEKEKLYAPDDVLPVDVAKETERTVRPRHVACGHPDRRHERGSGWPLIMLGTLFLLTTVGGLALNWWALLFLWPAAGVLGRGIGAARHAGRFHHGAREAVNWGLILGMVGLIVLLGLSWNLFWPVVLIIIGTTALLSQLGAATRTAKH